MKIIGSVGSLIWNPVKKVLFSYTTFQLYLVKPLENVNEPNVMLQTKNKG